MKRLLALTCHRCKASLPGILSNAMLRCEDSLKGKLTDWEQAQASKQGELSPGGAFCGLEGFPQPLTTKNRLVLANDSRGHMNSKRIKYVQS